MNQGATEPMGEVMSLITRMLQDWWIMLNAVGYDEDNSHGPSPMAKCFTLRVQDEKSMDKPVAWVVDTADGWDRRGYLIADAQERFLAARKNLVIWNAMEKLQKELHQVGWDVDEERSMNLIGVTTDQMAAFSHIVREWMKYVAKPMPLSEPTCVPASPLDEAVKLVGSDNPMIGGKP